MRYISLFIGGILALSACNEVKFAGNGSETGGVLTAGFRDTLITVFENAGADKLAIDFSQALAQDAKVTVAVAAEENMQENKNYFITAKELAVAAGARSADIEYALVDDNEANDSRSFTLKLMSVNGGVIDGQRAAARVKVLDDESDVAVGFETTALTVAERESGETAGESYRCEIPVKIYGTIRKPLQFKVALLPMEGSNAAVENVNFRLLQSVFVVENATDAISVPVEIIDDAEVNADRMFTLDITEVTGAEMYTQQKRCIVTIQNDDMGIYFGKIEMEAEERAGIVKIPVKLTGITDQPIAFTMGCTGSAVEGTDYSLEKTWTIEAGKDSIEIEVELKNLEERSPDRALELQFAQVPENIQVFDRGKNCTLKILDCSSLLSFEQTDKMILNDSTRLLLPIALSNAVEHNVTLKVTVTAREGISEEQASVVNSEITIPAGSVNTQVELALRKLTLKNKAHFKVEISDVYGATASENVSTVSKYYKYQTTDLAIASFTSEEKTGEPTGGGCAVHAIDGNTNTYWHSIWSGGNPQLPEGIVIKLPDNLVIMAVDVVRRVHASNKDLREMKIYLSESTTEFLRDDDGTSWGEPLGVLDWPNTASADVEPNTRHLELPAAREGKYLKLSCTQSWRNSNVQIAEVIVYGYSK